MSKKQADSPAPKTAEAKSAAPKSTLGAHKGKLAIGVAATLGMMVFYKWRERQLAKDDPESYAQLQRLKAGVTNGLGEGKAEEDHTQIRQVRRPRKDGAEE